MFDVLTVPLQYRRHEKVELIVRNRRLEHVFLFSFIDVDGLITAAGCEVLARIITSVRPGHRFHFVLVILELLDQHEVKLTVFFGNRLFPNTSRAVKRCTRYEVALRTPSYFSYRFGMTSLQGTDTLPRASVPNFDLLVSSSRCQQLFSGTPVNAPDPLFVSLQRVRVYEIH